jgi:hypothetical protein
MKNITMKPCKFLKEHIHLINLLSKSKDKKLLKEALEQTQEVLKYLKKIK